MRHAFLILGYNNFNVMKILLRQLDHKDFDIYIHMDKKVRKWPREEFEQSVKHAHIEFIPRIKMGWAEYSQIMVVRNLMEIASEKFHDYYHLLSCYDLMLVTQNEFIEFFEKNRGTEFVGFASSYNIEMIKYRNYFIAQSRTNSRLRSLFFIKLRKALISLQKIFNIENHVDIEVKKGTDWYSITHDAVKFILSEEPKFIKKFFHAFAPTEFIAQTILYNSKFREKLYRPEPYSESSACLRYIDWERGRPYTFREENYEELLNLKNYMFARKFDENTDMKIVELVKNMRTS